jgi:tetratricopeptide (TPR) repeat protein
VALVLDDVQQADLATLELLPALARAAAQPPAGAVPAGPRWWLAVRRGEQPAPLAAWMASSDPPRSVVLEALDGAAVRRLLQAVAPARSVAPVPAVPAVPDALPLQRYTGGIPLFVLETLRSLYEHAASTDPAAAGALPDPWRKLLAGDAPPAGAAAVVQGRLRRLPEAARQLATAAAVLHGPVSLADAAELLGSAPTPLLDAFRALQSAHWLDESGRMHDLVRQAVLADQAAPVRRWLHARAATQLAGRGAPAQEQARHWLQAGSPEQAAPLFQQSALTVRRSARPREETELWDAAIAAYEAAGQLRQAFAAWRESIEPRLFSVGPRALAGQTEALLQRAADDQQRLDAMVAHAQVQLLLAEAEPVRRLATEAMALAQRCGDADNQVKAGLVLANWLAQRGHGDEALAALDGLATVLAAAPALRHAWISTRSFVLHRAGRFAACAEMLEQAAALAEEANDGMELCTTRSNMASMLASLGRYDQAWAAVQVALRVREELGPASGVHHANVDLNHGYVLMGLGRPHSARAAMERARDAFAASDTLGTWQVIAGNALAAADLACGDAAAAASRLCPPVADTPDFVAARHHILHARALRALGQDPAPALARAEAVLGAQGDRVQRLLLQAERLCALPPAQAAEAAAGLVGLQAELQAIEQGAQASRLGWLAVERWLAAGDAQAAAAQLHGLLQPAAPRPMDLLPRSLWALAEQAWRAVGDDAAADGARRQQQQAVQREREDRAAAAEAARDRGTAAGSA